MVAVNETEWFKQLLCWSQVNENCLWVRHSECWAMRDSGIVSQCKWSYCKGGLVNSGWWYETVCQNWRGLILLIWAWVYRERGNSGEKYWVTRRRWFLVRPPKVSCMYFYCWHFLTLPRIFCPFWWLLNSTRFNGLLDPCESKLNCSWRGNKVYIPSVRDPAMSAQP